MFVLIPGSASCTDNLLLATRARNGVRVHHRVGPFGVGAKSPSSLVKVTREELGYKLSLKPTCFTIEPGGISVVVWPVTGHKIGCERGIPRTFGLVGPHGIF